MPSECDSAEIDQPPLRAVRCGRFIFIVVGVILFGVACWFAYDYPGHRTLFTATVMGVGFMIIWLGIALPPKVVAHLGLWLPWFIPFG